MNITDSILLARGVIITVDGEGIPQMEYAGLDKKALADRCKQTFKQMFEATHELGKEWMPDPTQSVNVPGATRPAVQAFRSLAMPKDPMARQPLQFLIIIRPVEVVEETYQTGEPA